MYCILFNKNTFYNYPTYTFYCNKSTQNVKDTEFLLFKIQLSEAPTVLIISDN